MVKQSKTWLDILPEELQNEIYKQIFSSCLTELDKSCKSWNQIFQKKYTCSGGGGGYYNYPNGCHKVSYPIPFKLRCTLCKDPICIPCWWRSQVTSEEQGYPQFAGMCRMCIWQQFISI